MRGPHSAETKAKISAANLGRHRERRAAQDYEYIRRHAPRASIRPSLPTIHWAAGIWEGEGTVGVFQAHAGEKYSHYRTLRSNVTQTDDEILNRLASHFGGSIHSAKSQKGRNGVIYRWQVYGPRALGFLYTIYPLLSEYRRQQVTGAVKELLEGGK